MNSNTDSTPLQLMDTAQCRELIVATMTRRGTGNDHSPIRIITQVFEKDGRLLAENDPSPETFAGMDMVHFARFLKEKKIDPDTATPATINKWLDTISNL